VFFVTVAGNEDLGTVGKETFWFLKASGPPYRLYKLIKTCIWVFPKIGVPRNGWFIMETLLLEWMIWGYPYFWKHPSV